MTFNNDNNFNKLYIYINKYSNQKQNKQEQKKKKNVI